MRELSLDHDRTDRYSTAMPTLFPVLLSFAVRSLFISLFIAACYPSDMVASKKKQDIARRRARVKCLARKKKTSYVRRCLPLVIPHILRNNLTLQQDGARPHSAKNTRAYLARKGVRLLEGWPASSPDLNCIEHAWHLLDVNISRYAPRTEDELCDAAQKAWDDIPTNTLNALVQSFPNKCRRVAAHGGLGGRKRMK